jgi:phage shock protein A
MMEDTDLSKLDLAGAKSYILGFATSAKLGQKEIAALDVEIGVWEKRVSLAEGRGIAELAAGAKTRLEELLAKRAGIEAEVGENLKKVSRMREELSRIAARERSIDPDRLLAELQLMAGTLLDEGGLDSRFKELEAEAAKNPSKPPPKEGSA